MIPNAEDQADKVKHRTILLIVNAERQAKKIDLPLLKT